MTSENTQTPPRQIDLGALLLFFSALSLTLMLAFFAAVWLLMYRLWCQLSTSIPEDAPGRWFYDLGGDLLGPLRSSEAATNPDTVEISILAAIPVFSLAGLALALIAFVCWAAFPRARGGSSVSLPQISTAGPRRRAASASSGVASAAHRVGEWWRRDAKPRLQAADDKAEEWSRAAGTQIAAAARAAMAEMRPRYQQADKAVEGWLKAGAQRSSLLAGSLKSRLEQQLASLRSGEGESGAGRSRPDAASDNRWPEPGDGTVGSHPDAAGGAGRRLHERRNGAASPESSEGGGAPDSLDDSSTFSRRHFLRNVLRR